MNNLMGGVEDSCMFRQPSTVCQQMGAHRRPHLRYNRLSIPIHWGWLELCEMYVCGELHSKAYHEYTSLCRVEDKKTMCQVD